MKLMRKEVEFQELNVPHSGGGSTVIRGLGGMAGMLRDLYHIFLNVTRRSRALERE